MECFATHTTDQCIVHNKLWAMKEEKDKNHQTFDLLKLKLDENCVAKRISKSAKYA